MKSLLACSLCIVLNAVPGKGCDEKDPCKSKPDYAISMDTRSADGLVVDEVTAELKEEDECRQSLADSRAFDCAFQGLGVYTLVLHSGKLHWTEKVAIERDKQTCWVKTKDLTIDVTRASADK